ncbi:SWIM zinc finger family protein [Streptomyces winkii]|uniref:SWIM zinc finger family protein n=1 Tax=Streptomyces winkii TaxID=3051178 RepID=UPI0028D58610|nr:SWIM zinc finger family protein [Streptomyces sp. DSM 40971]
MSGTGGPAGGGAGPHATERTATARTRSLPPAPARPGARGPFAETRWGEAWVRALEESALDAGRLSRGRTYARGGHVGTITVTPGRIAAPVTGSRPRPYRSVIRMRTLTDREWGSFLDTVCDQPAHLAALLDKDMPHALVDAAREAGVRLLPGPGDLDPGCSCPDAGRPCKHAAALCYQTARFLDADPFVLLLLRGRGEEELDDELARRNAKLSARAAQAGRVADTGEGGHADAAAAGEAAAPAGVPARDALATSVRTPLPAPLDPPEAPGEPPLLPELPGAPDPVALTFLATDAARRAHAALTKGPAALGPLPPRDDAIRLAATHPGLTGRGTFSARFARLARESGLTALELARAAAAWRQGGEGLALLESAWDPPAGDFDRARGALAAADLPRMTIDRNRLTDPTRTFQLRYGRDNRWYPYRSEAPGPSGTEDWWPEGPSDSDPAAALTALMAG